MTSTPSGFRRTVIAATAAVAALGLSACGAGQHTQTSTQVAAVDGGSGRSENVAVNNIRVVLPAKESETGSADSGDAQVGFSAAFDGSNLGSAEGIQLESVKINGQTVQIEDKKPLQRNCSLVATIKEQGQDQESKDFKPKNAAEPCISYIQAKLPAKSLEIGQSAKVEIKFQGESPISTYAGVIPENEAAGEFTRPVETQESGH